ncbi:hypothetical protein L1987_22637 [Smallanthus sonchifolius]|uniref:Uncharacterized protein n=1 Tax=Smallanthus sonchifolius TaxID=185202 RepID=A0ACB9IEP7_9ASTR|nr:hypothetical protein L1987_22637 [Smallanthus sonchifolius]
MADEFRKLQFEMWSQWFSRLYVWEGDPGVFERLAWIEIRGVPACLWDNHVFNWIGERFGRLVKKYYPDPTVAGPGLQVLGVGEVLRDEGDEKPQVVEYCMGNLHEECLDVANVEVRAPRADAPMPEEGPTSGNSVDLDKFIAGPLSFVFEA